MLSHVLQDYGLDKIEDGPQRGQAAGGLTIELENKFLYPDVTVVCSIGRVNDRFVDKGISIQQLSILFSGASFSTTGWRAKHYRLELP